MKREIAWSVAALGALIAVLLMWPRTPHDAAPSDDTIDETADSPVRAAPASPPATSPEAPTAHDDSAVRTPPQAPPPSAAPQKPTPTADAAAVTPQQALHEVQALVDRGTVGAARALAERYLRELPDSPETRQIMSLTGVHPHP